MKRSRIISLLLIIALMISMLAACAREEEPANQGTPDQGNVGTPDQGGSQTARPGQPDVIAQGVTDTTIKIGTISLVGGFWAFIGKPAYDGFRACVARLNAQGGVQGRQVELIAYDDQWDAAVGKTTIERFVEQDKVFMLASLGGNIVETSLDYLHNWGIPVINISSGLDILYEQYNPQSRIFQVQPGNMTDARYLIVRTLHEPIFGPNKNEKLPSTAKIGVIHGVDAASMDSLAHLLDMAEQEGASDRIITEGVTFDTFPTAIQKFRNNDVEVVIFMGIYSTEWIAAMDDAMWEVPVVFSYGASTLQSFVPDTYKPARPCYATVWGDYGTAEGQAMLDDMLDALSYLPDVSEAERLAYRDNNYCVAGYAYGMALAIALERYNKYEGEYGLNWDDFVTIMELEPFHLGGITFDYMNGKRMGIDTMAFLEYIGEPDTGHEYMVSLFPFETLDQIREK